MNKSVIGILLYFIVFGLKAQENFKIDIYLKVNESSATKDKIYITGNFNRWNPNDEQYVLNPINENAGEYKIQLNVPKGVLEYKFSRGSWKTLECSPKGRLINLHDVIINKDTILHNEIMGWRDNFPPSTVLGNVLVLEDFDIPQLNRKRDIRIYLPKDYQSSNKKYPVWYMHDGQDLFDEAISEGRIGPVEWGVDETLEKFGDSYIVVGIDHNSNKMMREQEYTYFTTGKFKTPEGKAYIEFIVENLKPYIDANYRTLSQAINTGIAGGSLGGLISLYASLTYPEVFGKVGVFSPSVWQDENNITNYIKALDHNKKNLINNQTYYFYAGGRENRKKGNGKVVQMDKDVLNLLQTMNSKFSFNCYLKIDPMGKHGAWYWQKAFAWMIGNENNNINLNNQ